MGSPRCDRHRSWNQGAKIVAHYAKSPGVHFCGCFEVEKFPFIEFIISAVDLKSYGTVSIAWTESSMMRLEMGTSGHALVLGRFIYPGTNSLHLGLSQF